jgi:hypothetical protein
MGFYYKLDPLHPKEIQVEIRGISGDVVSQFIIKKSFIRTEYTLVNFRQQKPCMSGHGDIVLK